MLEWIVQLTAIGILIFLIARSLKGVPWYEKVYTLKKDAGHLAWSDEFMMKPYEHDLMELHRDNFAALGIELPRIKAQDITLSEVITSYWSPPLRITSWDAYCPKWYQKLWNRLRYWFLKRKYSLPKRHAKL